MTKRANVGLLAAQEAQAIAQEFSDDVLAGRLKSLYRQLSQLTPDTLPARARRELLRVLEVGGTLTSTHHN